MGHARRFSIGSSAGLWLAAALLSAATGLAQAPEERYPLTVVGGGGVGDGGPALQAGFGSPMRFAMDVQGNLYVADRLNSRIRLVNLTAANILFGAVTVKPGRVETIAGNGQAGTPTEGAVATQVPIDRPDWIAVDAPQVGRAS